VAARYGLNQWHRLILFLEDGRIEMSNNRAERPIKPFAVSRKNFLFCNTSRSAWASAVIFIIIETAKENELNPYAYLNYLFENLPNLDTRDSSTLVQLFPWNVKRQRISSDVQSLQIYESKIQNSRSLFLS
jgi:transposase